MDVIFGSIGLPLWIVLAMGAVLAAYLYLGRRGAQIAAAAAAVLLAVFTIRRDARQDAEQDRLEEDLRNERIRNDRADNARRAGDRVRSDIERNPDSLRDDDGFRRD